MEKSIHLTVVFFAVATTLLFMCSGEAANAPEEDCPPGDVPSCEISVVRTFIEKYPHPNSCKYYFICSDGVPHCMKCKDGLYYNPGTERCDEIEREECKDMTTQPPPTSTVEATTQDPTPPEECGIHDPNSPRCPVCLCDGYKFKHPLECEWYYECENREPKLKHCGGGLHWNDKFKICDYPCLAGCNTTLEPPIETTPGIVEHTTLPPVISELPSPAPTATHAPVVTDRGCPSGPLPNCPLPDPAMAVYFPHALTCSWFYECSNGTPYCMPCPAGLHFNPKKNVCDWPQNAGCTVES